MLRRSSLQNERLVKCVRNVGLYGIQEEVYMDFKINLIPWVYFQCYCHKKKNLCNYTSLLMVILAGCSLNSSIKKTSKYKN